MGTMKSKSVAVLLLHTSVYTFVMFLTMGIGGHLFIPEIITFKFLWFFPVLFVFHTVQDFATSHLTSEQFAQSKYNGLTGAFTIIGFDQFLHYCQIFITYYYLTNY